MSEQEEKALPYGPFSAGQKVLWFQREESDWNIPVTVLEAAPATDDPDALVAVRYSTYPERARISYLMTPEEYARLRAG